MPDGGRHESSHRKHDKTTGNRQGGAYEQALKKYKERLSRVDAALKALEDGFEEARVTTQVLGTTHFQIRQALKATKAIEKARKDVAEARRDVDNKLGEAEESFNVVIAKMKGAPGVIADLSRMAEVREDQSLAKFTQDAREVLEAQNIEHSSTALQIWREAWQTQLEINNLYDPKKNRVWRERFNRLERSHTQDRNTEKLETDATELKSIQAEVGKHTPGKGKLKSLEGNFQKAMSDMRNLKRTVQTSLRR